jgi:flagellar hook-length control protein FliK
VGSFSGKWRTIPGAASGRIRRSIFEYRGAIWHVMNDGFFGYSSVSYPWTDAADANKFYKWTYTADGTHATTLTVDTARRVADIEATSGPASASSNLRELFVVPETATWGVTHARTMIISGPKFSVAEDIKPQHGLALGAQEDTRRRAILYWHDIAFYNPSVINVGIWSGNLDGTGFLNRQCNFTFSLGQTYTVSAASRTSNVVTATITGHNLEDGDRLNPDFGGILFPTHSQRTSNVVTNTLVGHPLQVGDILQVIFAGSFDIYPATITATTANTYSYNQTGANETDADGAGWHIVKTDDRESVEVTVVDANTVTYPDTGPNKTIGSGTAFRQFPYHIEARRIGSVAQVRAWDRNAAKPDWYSPTNALTVDLNRPDFTATVGASSRIGGVVTLVTAEPHGAVKGSRLNVSVGSSPINGNDFVAETVTNNNVLTYLQAGADIPSAGAGTVLIRGAAATQADIDNNPTPVGSGRIGFDDSHLGTDDDSRCVYGQFVGDNDPESILGIDQVLTGTASAAASATGTLSKIQGLAGVSPTASSSTGTLTTTAPLTAASPTAAAATGTLSVTNPLAGHADASNSATGALSVTGPLAGHTDTASGASGSLATQWALSASPAVASSATGILSVTGPLAATAPAASSARATVCVARLLSGFASAATGATGSLTVQRSLAGTNPTASSAAGALNVSRALSGPVPGAAAATGALSAERDLAGLAAAANAAAATLSVTKTLAGFTSTASGAVATLTINTAFTGTAPVAAAVAGELLGTAPLVGGTQSASSATGALSVQRALTGQAAIAQVLTGTATVDWPIAGIASIAAHARADLSTSFLGTVPAAASALGALGLQRPLGGPSAAASSASGSLSLTRSLTGVSPGTATARGVLSATRPLVAAAPVAASSTATLQVSTSTTPLPVVTVQESNTVVTISETNTATVQGSSVVVVQEGR